MHMRILDRDWKDYWNRLRIPTRRFVAGALTLAMILPMTVNLAQAAALSGEWPIKMITNVNAEGIADGTGEAPTITIETNGVIDQAKKLTGFVEVAIRVKPGVLYYDVADGTRTPLPGKEAADAVKAAGGTVIEEIQPFSSLAVALEYNAKLTPWEWEKINGNWDRLDESDPANQATAIDISAASGGGFSARRMIEIDPLHQSTRIAHAAVSPKEDGGGYLYLMAENFTAKDFNAEDTVLAVVRFKYDLDVDDENNNPWGTMFAKGLNNPAVTEWIDPTSSNCLVKLADSAVVREPIDPIIDWELSYDSGKSDSRPNGNGMYYSTDTSDGREAYDTTLTPDDTGYVSTTSNCLEVAAVDTSAATPNTTVVVPGKINYTLVNKLSYNFSSGDSAVILYYDWDDRHIGTQVLAPGDAREAVNNYVEQNFIHPALRYSAHKNDTNAVDYTDSLLREYTYRGEYPYDVPVALPDVTSPTYEADLATYKASIAGTVAEDGDKYPLTNKLDYVFFKRYTEMTQSVEDPDGTPNSGDETVSAARVLVDPDNIPDSGDEYYHVNNYDAKLLGNLTATDVEEPGLLEMPYIYGWAVVDDLDGISDVWTTLGTAEHTPYSGMDASQTPVDTTVDTTYGATGECLQFADFSDLKKGQVVRVKAVYEPGEELKNNEFYSIVSLPEYERYGDSDTSVGGVYAISYAYARVNASGQGVSRMRDPAARIDYTPDVEGVAQKPFSVGIDLDNSDRISVTYTPSSGLMSMEYSLRDKKLYDASRQAQPVMVDYNFYTGSERAQHGNFNNIMSNFNYTEHPYSQHLGSIGFVTQATFNQLDKLMREMVATGVRADILAFVNEGMLRDLNLKNNDGAGNPIDYESWDADEFMAKIYDAYCIAGDAELDWHQIQYHIWNTTYNWNDWWVSGCVTGNGLTKVGNTVQPAASTLAYSWCRLDNCTGGSSPINSWTDLMAAAADYVYTPNINAFNQLQDVFELRQGITAQPFADKDAMKTALITVVTGLQTNGFTQTQVEGLSWRQVQYLMDVGTTGITPTNLPANSDIAPTGSTGKDYWWENGGTKTISTWQELLEIQYHIINDNYFAGDNDNSGWRSGYNNPATALTGKVRDKDGDGNWKPTTDPNPFTTKAVALRKNGTGDNFDTLVQFDTALNTAISTLTGDPAYQGGGFANVSLMEIQHALLGNSYRSESDLMDDTVAGTVNYWWITGASTPKTLQELVILVKQVLDGAPEDLLDNVTVDLVGGVGFWLRADDAGTVFGSATDLQDALLDAVDIWCTAGNDPATAPWPDTAGTNWNNADTRQVWSQLQYLLFGNQSYAPNPDPGPTYDYWWYANGHKTINNLEELLEAAWNSWGNNGNPPSDSSDPGAMGALDETTANLKFINGVLNTDPTFDINDLDFRLNDDGDNFTSVANFKAQLKNFIQAATVYGGKDFILGHKDHWKVVQYYLINGVYQFDFVVEPDTSINYWWENGGTKPEGPSIDYTWANGALTDLSKLLSQAALENEDNDFAVSADTVYAALTDTMVRAFNFCDSAGTPLTRIQLAQQLANAISGYYYAYLIDEVEDGWDAYVNGMDELELEWAPIQNYILTGQREEKTPTDLAPGCTWGPASDITGGVSYTAASQWVTSVISQACNVWLENEDVLASDVEGLITEAAAADLNFQSGGVALNKSALAQKIADAVNEFYTAYVLDEVPHGWDTRVDGTDVLYDMDWASLQYWITTGNAVDLSQKSYEDMKGSYGIDWYPPNDPAVPGTFSLQAPMKTPAINPVEESESTDVVTSEDGLRTTTTKTVTTTDFKAGTVEIRKEIETVLTVGDKLVTTTDVYVTTVNMNTGEVTEAPAEFGTPVITDVADIGTPELPEETEKPEETEPPTETEPPAETEKPEEAEPPVETEKPEETEPPAETENPEGEEPGIGPEVPEEGDVSGDQKEAESAPAEPPTEQKLTEKAEIEGETAMSTTTTTIAAVQFPQSLYGIVIRQRERRLRWSMDSPLSAVLWGRGDYIGPSVDRPPIQRLRSPLLRLVSISQRDILTTGRTLI